MNNSGIESINTTEEPLVSYLATEINRCVLVGCFFLWHQPLCVISSGLNFWDEAWWFLSLRFSDYCLHLYSYFHNVSVDMSSGLLQVFFELGNFHGSSNYVLYWIHRVTCSDSVTHHRVQVLSIPVFLLACSPDWTWNFQMIVFLEA